VRLLGWILANRFVERVCTQRLDRLAAAGALGLGWADNGATRPAAGPLGGLAGWDEPMG
jgi:hypothetical protein